jgi:hypothetical protein
MRLRPYRSRARISYSQGAKILHGQRDIAKLSSLEEQLTCNSLDLL